MAGLAEQLQFSLTEAQRAQMAGPVDGPSASSQFGGQHDYYCALCRQSYKRSELHDGVMGAFSYCTHCLLKVGASYASGGGGASGGGTTPRSAPPVAPVSSAQQALVGLPAADFRSSKSSGDSTTRTCGTCFASKAVSDFLHQGNDGVKLERDCSSCMLAAQRDQWQQPGSFNTGWQSGTMAQVATAAAGGPPPFQHQQHAQQQPQQTNGGNNALLNAVLNIHQQQQHQHQQQASQFLHLQPQQQQQPQQMMALQHLLQHHLQHHHQPQQQPSTSHTLVNTPDFQLLAQQMQQGQQPQMPPASQPAVRGRHVIQPKARTSNSLSSLLTPHQLQRPAFGQPEYKRQDRSRSQSSSLSDEDYLPPSSQPTTTPASAAAGSPANGAASRMGPKHGIMKVSASKTTAGAKAKAKEAAAAAAAAAGGDIITKACSRCKVVKPASCFNLDRGKPDNLYCHCRMCCAEMNSVRNQRKALVTTPTVESKVCTRCKECKPAALFYRQNTSADGLRSWCKVCYSSSAAKGKSKAKQQQQT